MTWLWYVSYSSGCGLNVLMVVSLMLKKALGFVTGGGGGGVSGG